jgi:hypothetical protein
MRHVVAGPGLGRVIWRTSRRFDSMAKWSHRAVPLSHANSSSGATCLDAMEKRARALSAPVRSALTDGTTDRPAVCSGDPQVRQNAARDRIAESRAVNYEDRVARTSNDRRRSLFPSHLTIRRPSCLTIEPRYPNGE